MRLIGTTAGEHLVVDCSLDWARMLVAEGIEPATADVEGSLTISIDASRESLGEDSWAPFARGVRSGGGAVEIRDACTSGFDLGMKLESDRVRFAFRWRPPRRSAAARAILRTRFRLLARSVLVQYPALWWAAVHGRAPLHAAVVRIGDLGLLLAGPSGVGKTTVLEDQLSAGWMASTDNLCVSDGRTTWAVVEPVRSARAAAGARAPHGRREISLPRRELEVEPSVVLVLRRSLDGPPRLRRVDGEIGARALISGTYMAGELRRFWPLAATLAAVSGVGPVHPPIAAIATTLTERLPCFELEASRPQDLDLSSVLEEIRACV